MATPAHCLFCFEALASHFEDRGPMTLKEVQKSYAEFVRSSAPPASSRLTKQNPALRRLADTSSGASSSTSSLSTVQKSASETSGDVDTPMTSLSSLPQEEEEEEEEVDDDDDDRGEEETPLFVTWNTLSPRHGSVLRGCIGTFEAQPLDEGLSSYALTSALHDVRFDPMARRELPQLEVAVTLLTDFEDAAGPEDWDIGTHGIRISFRHQGRRYGATYLPDVMVEQGWDKEEALVSLMRKAGWVGRKDRWRDVELSVVRYQGKKQSLEYAEYKRWRDWVDGKKA